MPARPPTRTWLLYFALAALSMAVAHFAAGAAWSRLVPSLVGAVVLAACAVAAEALARGRCPPAVVPPLVFVAAALGHLLGLAQADFARRALAGAASGENVSLAFEQLVTQLQLFVDLFRGNVFARGHIVGTYLTVALPVGLCASRALLRLPLLLRVVVVVAITGLLGSAVVHLATFEWQAETPYEWMRSFMVPEPLLLAALLPLARHLARGTEDACAN